MKINPEIALTSVVVIMAIIFAVFLAAPSLSDGWRPFLALALPVAASAFQLLCVRNVRFRIWLYRLWYKVAGPSAEIQVQGTIHFPPESKAFQVLDRIKDIVRSWRANARIEAALDNRIVMSAGARSITVTIMPSYSEGDFHAGEEIDSFDLSFELRGYQTKVGMVNGLLDT